MDMTKLAYICGALRDGNLFCDKAHAIYRIRFYQSDEAWVRMVASFMDALFCKTPTITRDDRKGVWCATINSKEIYTTIIRHCEYPGSQLSWKTPSWIMQSDDDVQQAYVRGFFDAEGGVPHVDERDFLPKDIRIYFSQANKQSLADVQHIISSFSVHTGAICGPYYKKGYEDPQFAFMIHGIREVSKFFEIFGSYHPKKIERLRLIEQLAP